MKKYLQSSWMRVLSSIICTISIVTMGIGILAFAVVTEFGGTGELYDAGYDRIAENYGLYAVEMIEGGLTEELAEDFEKKQIKCSIKRVSKLPGENEEIITSEEVLFENGTMGDGRVLEIRVAPESIRRYRTTSLAGALFGYNDYSDSNNHWMEFPIEKVVFDPASGLFYYQTSMGLYEVERIIVEYGEKTIIGVPETLDDEGTTSDVIENGETTYVVEDEVVAGDYTAQLTDNGYTVYEGQSVDYVLGWGDGKRGYLNGYYDAVLNTDGYASWNRVIIDGWVMELGSVGEWANTIEVVPEGNLDLNMVRTGDYIVGNDTISCPYGEDMDIYQVYVSCEEEAGESLFSEWNEMMLAITLLYSISTPMIVFSFIIFVISFVLMIYSAKNAKEQLNFMEKLPVFLYSGAMFFVEAMLIAVIVLGAEWAISNDIKDIENLILLGITLSIVAVWLALNWFQNIVTRIKCKSFWRTSEIYYFYLLVKNSWNTIAKFLAFICKPFVAVYEVIKYFCKMAQENVPLFWGGMILFGVVSFIEFFIFMNYCWYGGGYVLLYIIFKVLEAVALMAVLYYMQQLHEGSKRVASGDMSQPIDTSKMFWKFKEHGENINKVSDGIAVAVNERMKSEHFKTELITNVSHDIKTPLTSIINYVDLIKKENVQDEKLKEYVDVLDRQSARLKKLIEDLMEASKASTGNLAVTFEECDIEVLLTQVIGEFEERLEKNQLEVVVDKPEHPLKMMADGRHMWRVLDNLLNNTCKYSLPGTRVYVSLKQENKEAVIVFKNISKTALNIPSEELLERFVRGDSSRNTEGSGLGLSIAQSLTELMKGKMSLEIDGDLFKVTLRFPLI